ncbi:hypothetical protein [Streptomyces sp. N35]|uniref:hypothetical protein n=1 Tax=Streptomyces sp. N35 TaxID=2795730 RepID=UPI0018F34A5E|nr:hypothetical protein [Streptomyces sp. N35]
MRGRGIGHRLFCLLVLTGLALLAACGSAPEAQPGPTVSKPVSKSPGCADQPELTGDGHLGWTGRTGRFQLTMRGSDCPEDGAAELFLSFVYGVTPDTAKVEFRVGKGSDWESLPVHLEDPGESDRARSSKIPITFAPGETRAYDFRITLNEPPEDVRALGIGATLAAKSGAGQAGDSTIALEYRTGQSVEVTAPASITPGAGWIEFQVEVSNAEAERRVRLDFEDSAIGQAYGARHEGTSAVEFEQFRSGRWEAMPGNPPASADFSLPKGADVQLRFRMQSRRSGSNDSHFGVAAALRPAGETPSAATTLAFDGKAIERIEPTLSVTPSKPFRMKSGAWGELRFTVENRTGVPYPPMHVEFSMLPDPPLGRMEYRAEDSDEWIELPTTEYWAERAAHP